MHYKHFNFENDKTLFYRQLHTDNIFKRLDRNI